MPPLTLFDLSSSRSIRIAWLLEALHLPYTVVHDERNSSGLSSADFKSQTGTMTGKAPVLHDDDLVISESGAITQYLLETYDNSNSLLPLRPVASRVKVWEYAHAAEATVMVHALPFVYARRVDKDVAEGLRAGLENLVVKDLEWLELELERKGGGWLVGEGVTVADIMMAFSVQFVFVNELAGMGAQGRLGRVREWVGLCERDEAYLKAVKRTGFVLRPQVD